MSAKIIGFKNFKRPTAQISEQRRRLMLEICEGNMNHPVLPHLYFLDGFKHCDKMLEWLVKNRITGNEIVLKIKFEFGMSPLSFAKWVIQRVNKDSETRPIIVGKDFR